MRKKRPTVSVGRFIPSLLAMIAVLFFTGPASSQERLGLATVDKALAGPDVVAVAAEPVILAAGQQCVGCHDDKIAEVNGGLHAAYECSTWHDNLEGHLGAPNDPNLNPRVHFDQEVCMTCHQDQYDTFEIDARGRTLLDQDYFPWARPADLENQYNPDHLLLPDPGRECRRSVGL